MCGICGIFDTENGSRANESILKRMAEKLNHRGPDFTGYCITGNTALGLTRLSIIDIDGGMQPMFNEDGTVVLVCNGEIFNFGDMRRSLELRGHKFRSNCDVEVILHLYEEYETEFINRLNGQFSFVIYDSNKNILLCARDHVGITPFFYTLIDGVFLFASEIKALLEHPGVVREVDLIGLDQIITFPGLISPKTMFKNISSLPCGHYMLVGSFGTKVCEYWDMIYPEAGKVDSSTGEKYYMEKLDEYISESVKLRLFADVPLGLYVSGGLDSAIIASKAVSLKPGDTWESFSIDFAEKRISEQKYQKMLADQLNLRHHVELIENADIINSLEKMVYYSESPLKETFNAASLALSGMTKKHGIKAVLAGEGADELFGGYSEYVFDIIRQYERSKTFQPKAELDLREKMWGDRDFFYEKDFCMFNKLRQGYYSKQISADFKQINSCNHFVINTERLKNLDTFSKRSYVDFKLRLSDHLLSEHGDRMAYANSTEVRYPFLDKNLIEFAATIPSDLKLKDYERKYILRRVVQGIVPEQILRRPKFSFVTPGVNDFMQYDFQYINDITSYETIKRQGYFNPDAVERLKQHYKNGNTGMNMFDGHYIMNIVVTFAIFLDVFNMPSL